MWARIVGRNEQRKTRLHNLSGRPLDAGGLLYLPRSVITTLSLKLTGRRPELPWLGYRAIKCLDRMIAPDWKVLEFGSGMSTLWLARRCGLLVSVETDRAWYDSISAALAERSIRNVDYRLRDRAEAHALADYDDSSFDFVLVDGPARHLAVMTAIEKVRPGGYVYLDNTDSPRPGNRVARDILLRAAGGAARVKFFTDLTPARLRVTEGMLACVPKGAG